ncbi:PhoH family protein [Methanopyrus sp. SNP6]|uniref:PhoH family protein n=1 Tax=Methanopyrus sp. SNP6 TaxID=1937005 RepID=UPI0011E6079E|nr:PhoH family protein [Methanopyrus sp. SNP6]
MEELMSVEPQTEGQERLVEALLNEENEIVAVFGPTGTGKTLFCAAYGVQAVMEGEYDRFIVTRPLVDVATKQEMSSADLPEKFEEMVVTPVMDVLSRFTGRDELQQLVDEGKIMIVDTHFVRGRTFDDAVILLDEVQNMMPENAGEVLARMGHNSRLLITGDPVLQKDIDIDRCGATVMREVLAEEPKAEVVDLGTRDIVRPGAERGVHLQLEIRVRNREMNDVEREIMDVVQVEAPDADVLTVLYVEPIAEDLEIKTENVPQAVIVTKEGHVGRVVGTGGERIDRIEAETNMRIVVTHLTLDFVDFIADIHPVPWIGERIVDVDIAGPNLKVWIDQKDFGPFMGQRGRYARYVEEVLQELLGMGLEVERA